MVFFFKNAVIKANKNLSESINWNHNLSITESSEKTWTYLCYRKRTFKIDSLLVISFSSDAQNRHIKNEMFNTQKWIVSGVQGVWGVKGVLV